MSKGHERLAIFIFGVVFIVTMLVLAVAFPQPTYWQYTVFRVVLALAAAGVAVMIPGSIEVTVSNWMKAGGAFAVFAAVFSASPAQLLTSKPDLMGPLEYGFDRPKSDFSNLPHLLGTPEECSTLCSGNAACKAMTFVKRPDAFGGGDCWLKSEAPDPLPNPNMVSAKKVGAG
ncbi:MAG TPA: PAN domain-containing protein [Steroidobacteraceae bacterium]|nr:PAN domain-containing protein [Steroidobacteraceae bacterium]